MLTLGGGGGELAWLGATTNSIDNHPVSSNSPGIARSSTIPSHDARSAHIACATDQPS